MGVQELRDELIRDVQTINATHFTHQITKTTSVPVVDDPAITYPNLADRTQKSKLLTSAVLFVDMRGSTAMSMNHEPEVLVPIYSSFVRAMSECSHFYCGYTRNIIGD